MAMAALQRLAVQKALSAAPRLALTIFKQPSIREKGY
jgi:hypothetical protein